MPINDMEYEFLKEVLVSVEGVGKATAANIITKREEFENLSSITREEISEINYLSEESVKLILEKISGIDFSRNIKDLYVEKIITDFLEKQYENVEEITLDDLDINILLMKALGFNEAEEAIKFYLYQRVTRSVVTSWGSGALENICKVAGSEEIPREDNVKVNGKAFDVRKQKDDMNYYIQLKSGPNTMNVGMVDSLNNMIQKIEEKHEDAAGMLGMTYGESSQVSNQIKSNLNDFDQKALSGKEFWEFLTDDETYYNDLIAQIDIISGKFENKFRKTFLELVEQKEKELQNDWSQKYGNLGEEGLNNFINEYAT